MNNTNTAQKQKALTFAKFILHGIILHILILLCYNMFTYVALPFLIFDIAYIFTALFKQWRDLGYPRPLFHVLFWVTALASLLISVPERAAVGEFIAVHIL